MKMLGSKTSMMSKGDVPGRAMVVGKRLSARQAGPGATMHAAAPSLPKVAKMAPIPSIPAVAGVSASPDVSARGIIGRGMQKTGIASAHDLTSTGGQPNIG